MATGQNGQPDDGFSMEQLTVALADAYKALEQVLRLIHELERLVKLLPRV